MDRLKLFQNQGGQIVLNIARQETREHIQTEAMPAKAPLAKRVGVSNCRFPLFVKN